MRSLFLVICLIASVYAYHAVTNVVVKEIKVTKLSPEFKLDWNSLINDKSLRDITNKVITNKVKKVPLAQPGTEAVINAYADKLFTDLDNFMKEDGLDPLALPDIDEEFDYQIIFDFTGKLDLTKGVLNDLSTAHRGGDVTVTYNTDNKFLEINLVISFNDLRFKYDYVAQLVGIGPSGEVDGTVRDVTVDVKLGFHSDTLQITLDDFVINHAGTIEVDFHGNGLLDDVLDILIDLVANTLEGVLELVLKDVIHGRLSSAIDSLNQELYNFLNPAPAA